MELRLSHFPGTDLIAAATWLDQEEATFAGHPNQLPFDARCIDRETTIALVEALAYAQAETGGATSPLTMHELIDRAESLAAPRAERSTPSGYQ
jgi:hypothetical protein